MGHVPCLLCSSSSVCAFRIVHSRHARGQLSESFNAVNFAQLCQLLCLELLLNRSAEISAHLTPPSGSVQESVSVLRFLIPGVSSNILWQAVMLHQLSKSLVLLNMKLLIQQSWAVHAIASYSAPWILPCPVSDVLSRLPKNTPLLPRICSC